jgi:hypothetical protein
MSLNPPVLRVVEFDRAAVRLGELWALRKDARQIVCSLWNHPTAPWELRVHLDGELVKSQAFRREGDLLTAAEDWKAMALAKEWQA